jgi:tetratricopeptide (TPR) repeat protein
MLERLHGPNYPGIGPVLSSYSVSLRLAGRMDEAERISNEALTRTREGWGPTHTVYAGVLSEHAWLQIAKGNPRSAETLLREAVRIRRDASGNTPIVGLTLAQLALAMGERGDFAAADSLTAEALRILRSAYPEYHGDIRGVHLQAAEYYEKWGIPEKAAAHRAAERASAAAPPGAQR